MHPGSLPFVLLLVLLLSACRGAFVKRAEHAYEQGRYLEVAEDLAAREPHLLRIPTNKQSMYGVYRGLALLKLGDYSGADQWLRYAYGIERDRATLAPHHRQRLDFGWEELQRLRGLGELRR